MNKNTINDPRCHKLGYSWRGWIPNFRGGGRWMLFATEEAYHDAFLFFQEKLKWMNLTQTQYYGPF